MVRSACYYDEGWYHVMGEDEGWEARLFTQRHWVEYVEPYVHDEYPDENDRAEVLAIYRDQWDNKELIEGEFFPMSGGEDLPSRIMAHFNLRFE
jgi:hypothetical protein